MPPKRNHGRKMNGRKIFEARSCKAKSELDQSEPHFSAIAFMIAA